MEQRLEQMVAATKRYGAPFALLVLDVDGPGARNGEEAMGVVSHAVRGSIRLMDEAFYSRGDGLCVLAPNQTAASAAQMAHRITEILTRLERASGLRITVSTGVVGCPEHGEEPSHLLRAADSAMWRARATGQPYAPEPELVDAARTFLGMFASPDAPAGPEVPFGPSREVPGDAPALDQVLALAGRDTSWPAG